MRSSKLVYLVAGTVASPTVVLGQSSTSPREFHACVTLTETTGSGCPALMEACVRPACIELQTLTLECGCASIFSTTACQTTCPKGCGTTYETVYQPCATSEPSPTPVTTTTTSASLIPSSSSTQSPPPTTPPSTSTAYPNTTMTSTSTTIVTITSCPESLTCTGQTTTWTGTTGPITCSTSSTCSGVLPGGPQTASGSSATVTSPGKTGPTPTASVSGSESPTQANEGSRYGFGVVEGGVLVGLIGAVWGMV